jgi:hypothetical protein
MNAHQLINDRVDVPVGQVGRARQNSVEDFPDEVSEIRPQHS